MAEYRRVVRNDEFPQNENENASANIKLNARKPAATIKDNTNRRPALGELGNRVLPKNTEVQKESVKDTKNLTNLKNVKPRVDTHWKKAAAATKKIVTRSDSMKSVKNVVAPIVKVPVVAKFLPKASSVTIKQIKTDSTAIVAKAVVPKPEEKKTVLLRREDSNLSKRSLSKLRAALCNKNKKDKNEPQPSSKIEQTEFVNESHSAKLLNQVENIDSDDAANPILVSEYVNDIYAYLYHLETDFPINVNHLEKQKEVTPKMRSVLVDWINEVHYQFHLIPETFHMTVGLIDRYLQAVPTTSRQHLQLVGVTSLFIAAKYEELYPPEITDFVYITDDTYNKNQILEMEKRIMRTLDFQVGRPLSIHFLRRFSKAAKAIDSHHQLSKYFIELVSVEYSLAYYKPSEIAAAALFLSLKLLAKSKTQTNVKDDDYWTPTLEFYSQYSIEHLTPLVKKIAVIVRGASTAKLKAVFNKYQSSKFDRISIISELSGPVIESICSA